MHFTNKEPIRSDALVASGNLGAAGAPASRIDEHGFGLSGVTGEPEFFAESHIVGNPRINLTKKIIEVMRSYKTGPNYFHALKVDRFD